MEQLLQMIARLGAAGLVVGVLVVVGPQAASADTITVTTTDDVVDATDGVVSLREAMIEADANAGADTVALAAAATYELTDCAAGALVHGADDDLTIDGNGATVEQTCADTRIIDKTGANTVVLTVASANLVGGPNSGVQVHGAAIRAESQVVLDGVTITGVDGNFDGSVVQVSFGPAAHDLVVIDSVVDGNTGTALANTSHTGISVSGSTITGNTGTGISLSDGNPIEIAGSTISGNGGFGVSTSGQGFGVQPEITITGTTIAGNGLGGVECSLSCRDLTMIDSHVLDNGLDAVAGTGGGITLFFFGTGNPDQVASATIIDSEISGNVADHRGGGLFIAASIELDGDLPSTTITNTTFDGNTASCAGCEGGAVSISAGDLTIEGSTFTGNSSDGDGGAIRLERAGFDDFDGALATFSMSGTTVTGNTAGGSGGGLWVHAGTQSIDASTISGNTAAGEGGGLVLGGNAPLSPGTGTIDSTTIAGNTASLGGGLAVGYPDDSSVTLVNSTVTGNEATTAGGGLAVPATVMVDLDHVTLAGNDAPQAANLGHSGPVGSTASVIALPGGGGLNCDVVPGVPQDPSVSSGGHSWTDDTSCSFGGDDIVAPGTDPQLGPLAGNGGPTLTRLPADGSPVVSVVPPGSCLVAVDQRGEARPAGTGCEPGAVEIEGSDSPQPLKGTKADDVLNGTTGDDHLRGRQGDDTLLGLAGDDRLDGGPGNDVLRGGPGDDRLRGGPGADVLHGGSGRDMLEGGPGNDLLVAGSPRDVLFGGPGRNLCHVFGQPVPVPC